MRGDIVYRVYALHEEREEDYFFGALRSTSEAEAEIANLMAKEMDGRNWADRYHNRGFVIREAVVDTDFEIPSRPKPRAKYAIKGSPKVYRPEEWPSTIVEVFRRASSSGEAEKVCEYERNYSMLQTFEPFRQGIRDFALISLDYTTTAVLDLGSGKVIAEEIDPNGAGFCPVGFYVPDWWDVNDGSIIPGSERWNADDEWPKGEFGFVWGCQWGDDSSWKVQYLDLSQVQQGIIRRDERFGYLELATSGYQSPCLTPTAEGQRKDSEPPFIRVSKYGGVAQVTFAVEMQFDLGSGNTEEWQRLKIANFE